MGNLFDREQFVTRESWGAMKPLATDPFDYPIVSVHVTSVGSPNTVRLYYKEECAKYLTELQKHEVFELGYPDIAYNFYIGGDGKIYEGAGWENRPTLTKEENPDNLETMAVAYMNALPDSPPSGTMQYTLKSIIDNGIQKNIIYEKCKITGITQGIAD